MTEAALSWLDAWCEAQDRARARRIVERIGLGGTPCRWCGGSGIETIDGVLCACAWCGGAGEKTVVFVNAKETEYGKGNGRYRK